MHHRLLISSCLVVATASTSASAQDADPIGERVEVARTTYVEATEKLRVELLEALAKREDAARKAGNKPLVDRIKAEREAFELNDELPAVVSSTRYKRGLASARSDLKAAMRTGVKEYLQARQDDQADALQAELDELEAEEPARPSRDREAKEPFVVAEWAHEVRIDGRVTSRLTYQMYSNGRINRPDGLATWRQQGRLLILRIPNADAPGGAWVDVCRLSPNRRSYVGKNQKGYSIGGTLIGPPEAPKAP
jgi:hypothetical protein